VKWTWAPRRLFTLIALGPAEDFRRGSALFVEGVRNPEAQSRIHAVMKRGLQTRDAEMDLARMLGDLAGGPGPGAP
jgi:hypothetical protein